MTVTIHVTDANERAARRTNIALAVLSGILLGCSFPPVPAAVLAYVGFVPLLIMISRIEGVMRPLRYSFVAMAVFNALTLYWVGAFTHGRDPYLMAAGAGLLIGHPFFLLLPIAAALLVRSLWGERWMLAALPLFWVGFEYGHSLGDIAFPWITIGNSQASDPGRIQFISWTGIYGASLLIMIVNVILAAVWLNLARGVWRSGMPRAYLTFAAALLLIILPKIEGELVLRSHPIESTRSGGSLEAGIVQPNIDPWGKWSGREKIEQLALYQRLTDTLARRGAKLVVWPETAMPFYILLPRYAYDLRLVETQIDRLHIALLTGFPDVVLYSDSSQALPGSKQTSITHEWYDIYNSAALFLPGDGAPQRYHKMLLVPFGEHVPYSNFLPFLNALEWGVGVSGWSVGRERTVFRLPGNSGEERFSTLICYESIYPSYVRTFVNAGAQFLVVITNDSWWGNTSGYHQHADYSRLRAIENRRWIVRCANGGVSAFIDPYGRMIETTPYDAQAVRVGTIGLNNDTTLYTQCGDYIAIPAFVVSFGLTVIAVVLATIKHRRKVQRRKKGIND